MRNLITIILLCTLSWSCKKPTPEPIKNPAKAMLTFPAQNEACTTGTIISPTQSSVEFKWNKSENTDSYELFLKNLESGTITNHPAGANNQLALTLSRNTPYSWYIISKLAASTTPAQSDTWKFYNAGPATSSFAPFPADALAPIMGANVTATGGKITLSWTGSDADNDIATYDVYLGTTNTPPVISAALTASPLANVTVTANTLYYWKVITKDSKGNTSDSGIYQFKVN